MEFNRYDKVPENEALRDFMKGIGIPAEHIDLYREFVTAEYGFRSADPQDATRRDVFGVDRAVVVKEQNERIKKLRELMETTEIGKAKIAQMKADGVDGSVPFPVETEH